MIPVIAYLIFRANKKYRERIKNLGLWLIPVILIPAIWPAYAISVGEYDNWYSGVFSQAGREGSGVGSIGILFKIDPVLVSIGIYRTCLCNSNKKRPFPPNMDSSISCISYHRSLDSALSLDSGVAGILHSRSFTFRWHGQLFG